MNIDRGLFRFFLIGLFAVALVFPLAFTYYVFVEEKETTDYVRQQFIADLSEPACKEIIAKRGTADELRDEGCWVSSSFWNRALELSNRTGQEIDLAFFDEVLSDYLFEHFFQWFPLQLTAYLLGLYVAASLMLYLAYRILRWGFAGFKSK